MTDSPMTSPFDPSLRTQERWYGLNLNATEVKEQEHERLKLLFEYSYLAAHKPKNMALWFFALDDGSADIYISPGSVLNPAFIRRYAPKSCAPPSGHLIWLAGDRHPYESRPRAVMRAR